MAQDRDRPRRYDTDRDRDYDRGGNRTARPWEERYGYASGRPGGYPDRAYGSDRPENYGRTPTWAGPAGFGPNASYPESRNFPDYDRGRSRYADRENQRAPAGERSFIERAEDEVSSWFGDHEAERRRRGDQFRGVGPSNYTRSDSRIEEDVNDRLTDHPGLDARGITITVENCEVTLSGNVPSRSDKRWADDCAESVPGVKHVQNNLRVRSPDARAEESDPLVED